MEHAKGTALQERSKGFPEYHRNRSSGPFSRSSTIVLSHYRLGCGYIYRQQLGVDSLVKDSASVTHQELVVGHTWALVARIGVFPWFYRVDTYSNPVNGLSRGDFSGIWNWQCIEFPQQFIADLEEQMMGYELWGPNLVQHKTTSCSIGSYIHGHEHRGHGLWTRSIITVYDTVYCAMLNYKIHSLRSTSLWNLCRMFGVRLYYV